MICAFASVQSTIEAPPLNAQALSRQHETVLPVITTVSKQSLALAHATTGCFVALLPWLHAPTMMVSTKTATPVRDTTKP
jgi:hypothetical protein